MKESAVSLVLVWITLISAGLANYYTPSTHAAWSSFKLTFNKSYSSREEEHFRMKAFTKNLDLIESHNLLYRNGTSSYSLGLNSYADLSAEEISHLLLRRSGQANQALSTDSATFLTPNSLRLPAAVDWRKKGYVTPVRFQGLCGSCWAFSAVGAVEGQHYRKTGVLRPLSEQQLVDCSGKYGNNGCFGGDMGPAFSYIHDAGGVESDQDYPYRGFQWKCRFNKSEVTAMVTGHVTVPSNESALQAAVASVGPISVGMTTPLKFIFYREGVFDDPQCVEHNLGDHAILAVGYGTYQGADYWLIKNSFGTLWGMDGYGMMSRNKNNQCNIANGPTYPLV